MGGFFGVASKKDCVLELFYGVDYHSHLGTRRGGMAAYGNGEFCRAIHNIENAPFRTKFDRDVDEMKGNLGIGCISDYEPQPLLIQSHHGSFAIVTVGKINNEEELLEKVFEEGQSPTKLLPSSNLPPYISFALMRSISFCCSFLYLSRPLPHSPKNKVFRIMKGKTYRISNGTIPLAKIQMVPIRIKHGIIPPQRGLFIFVHKRFSATINTNAIAKPATSSRTVTSIILASPFPYISLAFIISALRIYAHSIKGSQL